MQWSPALPIGMTLAEEEGRGGEAGKLHARGGGGWNKMPRRGECP